MLEKRPIENESSRQNKANENPKQQKMCPYQSEMLLMTRMVTWCHREDQNKLTIRHVITHFTIQITELVKGVLVR